MVQEEILPDGASFWEHIETLLQCPNPGDVHTVNTKLIEFIKAVADHTEIHVNEDQEFYRCGASLLSSPIYQDNKLFCISKMLSCLDIDMVETHFKLFISYVLLLDCKNDSSLLQIVQDYQGFRVLYHNLHNNFETLVTVRGDESDIAHGTVGLVKKMCTMQMDLLFQICKFLSLSVEELRLIDDFFVNYIFESLNVNASEENVYNFSKFELILAINEQFMIAGRENNIENKVLNTIRTHSTFRNFSECLLVYFNREEDICLQIMISKILYLILTDKSTSELFYNNDLNVLVDVLMRELTNLSEEEESVRNTFLRVLYPLLNCSHFESTHYKKDRLVSLLKYFAGQSDSKFWHQTESTKRLSLRCLSVHWLRVNDEDNASSEPATPSPTELPLHLASNNSSASINSMSKKLPPPIPLPRKVLSRGNSGSFSR